MAVTPELRELVERLVKERIEEIVGRVRMSSVEISRTSTGKAGFNVKVYNPDPYLAVNRAREIEQRLAAEYGMIGQPATGDLFEASEETAPDIEPTPPLSDGVGMTVWDD